jgi:P4 family phage/plasmid primase-like protien
MGKYKVPEEEYDSVFLSLLHDHVFKYNQATSILEKHLAQSPILIDLDFRYKAGGPLHRRFTTEQIHDFVAAYADAFSRFFEATPEPLQFFVQLKPAPEADPAQDTHKDGIHIVVPNVTTQPEIQYAIRGYLLQTGAVERIFGPTGMTNGPQDCFDISVIQRNNWFLYGACKPNKAWYKVDHVWKASQTTDDESSPISLEAVSLDTWTPLELVKKLSIRLGHEDCTPLVLRTDEGQDAEWVQLLNRWGKGSNWAKPTSPTLFSMKGAAPSSNVPGFTLDTSGAAATGSGTIAEIEHMVQVGGLSVRSMPSPEEVALAYRLVSECLNPERRCGDYQDWIKIALCLKNISDTESSFQCWAGITRRTGPGHKKSSMTDSELKAKWNLLSCEAQALQKGRTPLRMGTLHKWAREDSEATYKAIIREDNIVLARANDAGSHVSVAELVISMFRHEFRCTPERGTSMSAMIWYQYTGHAWKRMLTNVRIRERLSNEVRGIYHLAISNVNKELASPTLDQDNRQRLEAKNKNLNKVLGNLHTCSFKDSVMREVAEKFYDEEFLQNLNKNITLVGFANGVLDLRKSDSEGRPHVHFRPGDPDDCISFQMGRDSAGNEAIPFVSYDPEHPTPEHLEILDFFRKIYPDPVLCEYVLTLYAASLEGANHEQKFYVMQGSGGNGKSKVLDLISKTFGEYQDALPVTALTRKRADAGSANPELIVLRNKRFISMVEPEEGEKINTSLMKQLTGGDPLKARGLFKDQEAFVVTGRMFISCNNLPPVSSMDNGTWRRIMVIPHVATFVEEGKPTDPTNHIWPRDPLLDTKIQRWRPYFAGLLAHYYETRYLRGGLKEPVVVTAASNKYKEENDTFVAFCKDCLLRQVGQEANIDDIFSRYNDWFGTTIGTYAPGKKKFQKKDLQVKMQETYGKPVDRAGKVFAGIQIAYEGDDVSGNYIG